MVLENASDLFSAPVQIKFDPKVLRLNDVAKGTLLGSDGQQVIFTKNILNDTGTATVNLNRMPGTSGVSGSGTLVTLTFQVVGRGIAIGDGAAVHGAQLAGAAPGDGLAAWRSVIR